MPKIDIGAMDEINRSGYPDPFNALVSGRFRKRLGDAGGLTQFGVNLTRLAPGSASAQRHWHHKEDEFVFILSGEAVLIDDAGEHPMGPGDAAAFKASDPNGHHIVNRSNADVMLLEIGSRMPGEAADYPDIDLKAVPEDGKLVFRHKDGSAY